MSTKPQEQKETSSDLNMTPSIDAETPAAAAAATHENPESSGISHLITFTSNSTTSTSNSSGDDLKETTTPVECETRLWIGNLDSRLREYHLLKMVQRYGTIDNFDFLFHRTGPNIGLPRGYAFVTFQDKESAEKCLKSLDGTKVLDKNVAVRWAHQATTTFLDEETKLKSKLLTIKKEEKPEPSTSSTSSKEKAITAIEAKLKAMEREKETGDGIGTSSSFFYQYNKEPQAPTIRQRPRPYDRSRYNSRRPHRR